MFSGLSNQLLSSLIAFGFTVLAGIVARLLQPKAKVLWSTTHGFVFSIHQADQSTMLVYTETVLLANVGRDKAENVEVHFNYKPANLQIWPSLNYETEITPENRYVLRVKTLAPKEHFSIELLDTGQLPDVLRVRHILGEGLQVRMMPMRVFPPWFNFALRTLLVLGFFTAVYLVTIAVVAVISRLN